MTILIVTLILGLSIGIFLLINSSENEDDFLDVLDNKVISKEKSLDSRFDHVEKVKEIELPKYIIGNDDFDQKELTPHVAEIVNKDSKKSLQKRVKKPNNKSRVL